MLAVVFGTLIPVRSEVLVGVHSFAWDLQIDRDGDQFISDAILTVGAHANRDSVAVRIVVRAGMVYGNYPITLGQKDTILRILDRYESAGIRLTPLPSMERGHYFLCVTIDAGSTQLLKIENLDDEGFEILQLDFEIAGEDLGPTSLHMARKPFDISIPRALGEFDVIGRRVRRSTRLVISEGVRVLRIK